MDEKFTKQSVLDELNHNRKYYERILTSAQAKKDYSPEKIEDYKVRLCKINICIDALRYQIENETN